MSATRLRSGHRLPVLLAILAGALQAASLAWPFGEPQVAGLLNLVRGQAVWWLQLLAMAALVTLLIRSQNPRQAAWRGWWFSLAWLSSTFAWLYTSMHVYGGLAAPLAALAVLALAAALALYYALACWSFRALLPLHPVFSAKVFAALWLLAELARGQWLTGFGWGAVGYAQLDGPLQPLLPWVGVYGVTFLAAVAAGLLAQTFCAAGWQARGWAALALVAVLLLPAILPPPAGDDAGGLSVTLLQGNIAQDEKFEPGSGVPKALRWYGEQLLANTSSLVITAETALPILPSQLPEGYWPALQSHFRQGQQAALVGIPLGSYTEGYTNAVVGWQPGQTQDWRYDKHHLVPFGEFIPPGFGWFIDLMQIPLGDFSRGALAQPTFDWQGQRLATSICYENLYGNEMAAQFVDAQKAPTILVNLSNLGWFGDHLAMDQHLQIARTRALEFDRPFLLATNTGHTAILNRFGQVTAIAPAHSAVALQGRVQGRSGLTPYAAWVAQLGLWPFWCLALLVLGAAGLLRRRRV